MSGWQRIGTPTDLADMWRREGLPPPAPVVWRRGKLLEALVGRESIADGDPRWHISIRAHGRVPSWDELVDAAHELRPGVVFCMPMPPRSWWINVHEHVLHLWEIRDANLERQWEGERLGQVPT